MEGITLQIVLAVIMFVTTAAAGLLPLKMLQALGNNRVSSWILTLLSCFAGGVFLATCFLDIFPHVNKNYEKYRSDYGWHHEFPLPEFMACLGFFFVYFIEELSLKVFGSGHSHHGHSHGNQKQNLNPQEVLSIDQPLKMKTDLNGSSTIIHSTKSLNEGLDELERKNSHYSINTHGMVMEESLNYLSSSHKDEGFLRAATFAFAMSFHSILEGFALGVQNEKAGIMTLFLSLIIHKGIEAFSVGLQVSRSTTKRLKLAIVTIIIYSLMTPVGSMIGVFLTNLDMNPQSRDLVIILLEGCASGTFIFVTFFEVLAHERANDHSNLIQLGAIVVGFFLIAGLQASEHFTERDEGAGHVHG